MKKELKNFIITTSSTIKDALKVIDQGAIRIAIVVDSNMHVLGTLNDGDIRRALLHDYTLDSPIESIYKRSPIVCSINDSKELIIQTAIKNKVYQIPIIDTSNRLIDIEDLATLLQNTSRKNKVILMAGGLGTRLRPLTNDTPKPLLKVGNQPILETIIKNFASYGFKDITISVNYKSSMIKEYFKDGSKFDVNIDYLEEDERMGTAGALSLLKNKPNEPFFVMNGDLLTNVNFSQLLDFHVYGSSTASMCVREYDFQVPYGVIDVDKNSNIKSIIEKPVHKFFVNAGIYVLSPEVLDHIPSNEFYDMPTLFEKLIEHNKKTLSFPIHEYWLDIGRIEEFERANKEYYDIWN